MSKILGFVGVESYDLMHYLSRTMVKLGASVLMIDCSADRSLTYSVPNFYEFSTLGIIDYSGVDITDDAVFEVTSEQLQKADYDYVLIYFGFNRESSALQLCEEVYLVTDLQLHNVYRLEKFQIPESAYAFLVVRDRFVSKVSTDFVLDSVKKYGISKENVIYLDDSSEDLNSKILCQYNSKFTFKRVSKSISNFIVKALCVDFEEKAITSAFRLAARG